MNSSKISLQKCEFQIFLHLFLHHNHNVLECEAYFFNEEQPLAFPKIGKSTVVFGQFIPIHSISPCFPVPYSSLLISSHNKVYQSLALLVRWADHVLLHGIQSDAVKPKLEVSSSSSSSPVLPSVSSLEEVAALVQDAVKDLVQIAVEKLKEGDSIYGNKKQRQTSSNSSTSSATVKPGVNDRNGR